MEDATSWEIAVDLSPTDLTLIRTALRHLLTSEDDHEEIVAIKRLLERLPEVRSAD
jgi:Co/Zn/Cd efflux system component